MKRIGILTAADLMPGAGHQTENERERDEQMRKLVPAFAKRELALEHVQWRNSADVATDFDAMLPLFVWDYFEGNDVAFLSEMEKVASKTQLLNGAETLKWNSIKTYLDDLGQSGAPTIQTILTGSITKKSVADAFEELQTDQLVIKPQVGGGAWRQVLYNQSAPFPSPDTLPPGAAMIQAFLPSVQAEGEYSFLYFGGEFSHALVKRPKPGDYRIQSMFGGREEAYNPSLDELSTAESVLGNLKVETPLYARVDLLRGRDGNLKLIELELIEPYLYLPFAVGEGAENIGAQKLADVLIERLK